MNNKVTLYIAEHNETGLKYFGKTVKYFTEEDLQKHYHGSGVYWNRHLKKHGNDVRMKIYGVFDIKEVENIALNFSKENNIVESKEWANLMEENGIGGGDTWKNYPNIKERKEKLSKSVAGVNNPFYGKQHKKENLKKGVQTRVKNGNGDYHHGKNPLKNKDVINKIKKTRHNKKNSDVNKFQKTYCFKYKNKEYLTVKSICNEINYSEKIFRKILYLNPKCGHYDNDFIETILFLKGLEPTDKKWLYRNIIEKDGINYILYNKIQIPNEFKLIKEFKRNEK